MMGPASGGLQVFTLRRKARKGVGYSGTPWSGHAVNWNWRTSRFSLEPFWKEQREVGWIRGGVWSDWPTGFTCLNKYKPKKVCVVFSQHGKIVAKFQACTVQTLCVKTKISLSLNISYIEKQSLMSRQAGVFAQVTLLYWFVQLMHMPTNKLDRVVH